MIDTLKKHTFIATVQLFLLLAAALLFASPAAAAQDPYFYPGYDAAANGPIDLMKYIQQITVTVNGVDYTQAQLQELKAAGSPVTQAIGGKISFNFLFSLQGRAYAAEDATQLVPENSTHVVYTHGTTSLNGESVAAGQSGILDDSSLMQENTSADASYLRLDISWIYEVCPGDYTISYTDGTISFRQGSGSQSSYLYVYFPGGMGGNEYANPGYFTLDLNVTKQVDHIRVPGSDGYYIPGTAGWDFDIVTTQAAPQNSGSITTYGDITVRKVWLTDDATHRDAKIQLAYNENGSTKSAVRTISGDSGSTVFTVRSGMKDCQLSEDMTGLEDYECTLTASEDGKTYTFTNTKILELAFLKKGATGDESLTGCQLELYRTTENGETLLDSWTTTAEPHTARLQPGNYRLHEAQAPAGYATGKDIPFTVTDAREIQLTGSTGEVTERTLVLRDAPLRVKLLKTDPAGTPLRGATLALLDETTGTSLDSWATDGTPHILQGAALTAGHSYLLSETAAPAGYRVAAAIRFVLNADGSIPGWAGATITMQDAPIATATPVPTPTPVPSAPPTATPAPTATPPARHPTAARSPAPLTGDSPLMWVWLGLGFGCLAAALAAGRLHHAPRRKG